MQFLSLKEQLMPSGTRARRAGALQAFMADEVRVKLYVSRTGYVTVAIKPVWEWLCPEAKHLKFE